jgi:hypothetical protein
MDTKPILGLPERIKGFDILIHEATSDRTLESKANKFGHSTAAQAATIAKEADVKRLYLIHISPRYRDPRPLIEEAKDIFEATFLPSDLDEFEIPLPESWKEEDKLWVVAEDKEGEEAEGEETPEVTAPDAIPTEAEELADATEVYDTPEPGEVPTDLVSEAPIPTEVAAAAEPEPVPEPEPAITAEGISLGAVAAAMESKASASPSDEEELIEVEKPVVEEEEEEEFDLEAAMKEVGLDPNAD